MSTPRTPRRQIFLKCRNPDCAADQKTLGKIAQWRPSPRHAAGVDITAVDAQYPTGSLSADGKYDHSKYCPNCATKSSPWQSKYLRAAQSGSVQGARMLRFGIFARDCSH